MKKLVNDPARVVGEMLEGLVGVHPGLALLPDHAVVVRADLLDGRGEKVALISGGGSGHEPAHAGYVGCGMLAAAVAGDVFTSPAPDAIVAAIRAVGGSAGVLLIVKNYTGDRLNFGLAAEIARGEGIPVEMVLVADDVALGAEGVGRRGLAGTILVHKIAGAAAEAGAPLAEVTRAAREAADAVRTMGVALSPCTVPASGIPSFALAEDEIEIGLGIHGEPGVRRGPLEPADVLVDRLLGPILAEVPAGRVALMVNNLGGSTAMELAIVARHALAVLEGSGRVVDRAFAGTFLSALEMAGVSLSVLPLDDARLASLDAPTDAPAWPNAANRPRRRVPSRHALAPVDRPTPGPPRTAAGKALEDAIRAAASSLIEAEPHLTDLDRRAGDGDLGISLARGARAILDALPEFDRDDPPAAMQSVGMTLQRALGGTSGPFYAILFLRAAAHWRATPDDLAGAFRVGCEGIANLGGASEGDRTMLDALFPAARALEDARKAGASLADAVRLAALAAEAGAERTKGMSPRRGRSSYLGDRVAGIPDPGAVGVAIWLRAAAGSFGK